MKKPNVRLAVFLKELRINKLLSQDEIARKCGVSPTSWSKWELGNSSPSLRSLRKIIKAFGLSHDAVTRILLDFVEEKG